MDNLSYISNAHPAYLENIYSDYQKDPKSVDEEWKKFFDGFEFALAKFPLNGSTETSGNVNELKVYQIIQEYRNNGHLVSDTNPIRPRRLHKVKLDYKLYGLTDKHLNEKFEIGSLIGLKNATLNEIIEKLKYVYTSNIGFEFEYINDLDKKEWFRNKVEQGLKADIFKSEDKEHFLRKLNQTVVFEKFLGTKYVGQKRFSLEGGESTIPALDMIINTAAENGVVEVVIGMAHRGRLNVLANIMGKTYEQIFNEFEGNGVPDTTMGDGDVKYHLGYAAEIVSRSKNKINVQLCPNPSHLEMVNPVVEGFARSKADAIYKSDYDKILPVIVHGDAAVAGQGIVYELLQMSKLDGYYTGGSVHFVINNQIGFTTDYDDARSSIYCTSLAATVGAPVIHVNGDHVEAVAYAAQIATEYRQKFNSDILIDLLCYRKHGHNEGDDPKFTQPKLYDLISKHKNPRDIYIDFLKEKGDKTAELADKIDKEFWALLQDRLDMVKEKPLPYNYQGPELAWKKLRPSVPKDFDKSPSTAITKKVADTVLKGIFEIPKDFEPLRKVNKLLTNHQKQIKDENKLDWAAAELLAYGSILLEGNDVRMSGQDVVRGTFSHRHSVLFDTKTGEPHNRLSKLAKKQGRFMIYNSLLSELAVLGFEFGYSMANPNNLVIWEAQFGDFANGAQTIIDQFISSSESKWNRMSGLVMLLPHGYEGQGPEHSSARLERFLQLSAEYNMTVANITTPANFFHALRRQLARPFRKPLIVMSPKKLLRYPKCVSTLEELTTGSFKELIDDDNTLAAAKVKSVLCCSGKVYYDLLDKKEELRRKDVAIVRLEQLFPLPYKQLDAIVKKYKNATFTWVQEEPSNMGSWAYLLSCYRKVDWQLISRKASASPATGYSKVHIKEQEDILTKSFA